MADPVAPAPEPTAAATQPPDRPADAPNPAAAAADHRDWDDDLDLDPDDAAELADARQARADAARPTPEPEPKPEPAAEAKPEPEPEPEPARPPHPRALVERARALGIGDLDSYSTADLRAEVQQALDFQRLQASHSYSRPQQQQPSPQPPPPAPKPAEEPADVLKELGIDREKWEPEIAGAFEKLARQNADLQKQLGEFAAERRQQGLVSTYDALDGFFAGLPDADRARFGDGDRFTLAADAPEVSRRLALVRAAGIDLENPPHPRQLERMLREAHATLYPAQPAAPKDAGAYGEGGANGNGHAKPAKPAAPRDPETGKFVRPDAAEDAERKAAWMAAAAPMPTERRDAELPPGEERAVRNLAARLRARGKAVDDE